MAKRPFEPALYQHLNDALTNSNISERQNRLLALVALFQASQLTYLLATQGKGVMQGDNAQSLTNLLKASLAIEDGTPASLFSLDIFGEPEQLQLGLRNLEGCLAQPYQNTRARIPIPRQTSESFRYAMALIQLEKKVYKKPVFVQHIKGEQANIFQRLDFFDQNILHPAILASFAALYVETAGQVTPRLPVRGRPEYLKNLSTIDTIRACLFAGLQAAHFWRQLGGTRWQLIFGRKKMLEDLRHLAALRYQTLPDIKVSVPPKEKI